MKRVAAGKNLGARSRRGRAPSVSRFLWFWVPVGLLGVLAVVLSMVGWYRELTSAAATHPMKPTDWELWVDVPARSIKSLLLSDIYFESHDDAAAKVLLRIARTAGIVFSVLVALRLILVTAGSRAREILFRWGVNRHLVIIGGGPAAEEAASNPDAINESARGSIHLANERAPMVGRRATIERAPELKDQLRTSAAKRAKRVLICEGDDSDTWQTAQAIANACRKAEVLAHIGDPWVLEQLSREEPEHGLWAFSYAGGVARQVMLAHPPYLLAEKLGASAQHIVVIGFGQVGQAIAREFIVTNVLPQRPDLLVTVVDLDATRISQDFRARYPDLEQHQDPKSGKVDFVFIEGDVRTNDHEPMKALQERCARTPVCAVYVAVDDAQKPLTLAFAVRALALQTGAFRAPIFVCAQHGAGLPTVRQGCGLVGVGSTPEERDKVEQKATTERLLCDLRIVSFGSWAAAFDGAGLMEPVLDGRAQRFHEDYLKLVDEQERAANPKGAPGSGTPWKRLADKFRISNRRVAAHIRAKARAAGYDLESWLASEGGDWLTHELPPAADKFAVKDRAFLDSMAEAEHRRWMLDKFLDGWRKGPKDKYAKLNPDLVPFSELGPKSRGKDDGVIITTANLLREEGRQRRGK